MAPLPRNKRHQTRTYSQGYPMGKASKNADAAWELTKFLSGEESLMIHDQDQRGTPTFTPRPPPASTCSARS